MPSLKDALVSAVDMSGYEPSTPTTSPTAPTLPLEPVKNTMIRCPMPPLWSASPDSLRQFYVGSAVPQSRIMTPNPVSTSGGTSTENVLIAGTGTNTPSGGGGGGGGSTNPIQAAQVVIVTPVLPPNTKYTGAFILSKSFQLLSIATGSACRVQLYGAFSAQMADLARGLDVSPGAGTAQNIITDIALDTMPYQWVFQNRMGANGDVPQNSFVYVTITNLDAISDVITLTLQYVPLEA